MKKIITIIILYFAFIVAYADEEQPQVVKVTDPFIEVHTGPSVGYPIFYIIKRDETISIIKNRTEWFKIKTHQGKQGWVHRSQMVKTLSLEGEAIHIKDITLDNLADRSWEMGILSGDFEGSNMMSIYYGYTFTENLSTEISLSQILGTFSSNLMLNIDAVHQPFPEWRVSPFFILGLGIIQTSPRTTLVQQPDTTDNTVHVGLGVRTYLTRRFLLRAEYKSRVIFQSRDENEEVESWQLGFSVFF